MRLFGPATVVPLHHSAFSLDREPIGAFERGLLRSGLRAKLLLLTEGDQTALK